MHLQQTQVPKLFVFRQELDMLHQEGMLPTQACLRDGAVVHLAGTAPCVPSSASPWTAEAPLPSVLP